MEVLLENLTQYAMEIIVVVVGSIATIVLNKVKGYFETLKKDKDLGIIDKVTDIVVEYAEAELKGEKGKEKRDFAVDKAIAILAQKGINVDRDEVIAGIEQGVNKLNKDKK